jgi:hypothetical protein
MTKKTKTTRSGTPFPKGPLGRKHKTPEKCPRPPRTSSRTPKKPAKLRDETSDEDDDDDSEGEAYSDHGGSDTDRGHGSDTDDNGAGEQSDSEGSIASDDGDDDSDGDASGQWLKELLGKSGGPKLSKANVAELAASIKKQAAAKLKEMRGRHDARASKKQTGIYSMDTILQAAISEGEDKTNGMSLTYFQKASTKKTAVRAVELANQFKIIGTCLKDRTACMLGLISSAGENMPTGKIDGLRELLKNLRAISRDMQMISARADDMSLVQAGIAAAVLMSDDYEGNASEGFLSAVEKQWLLLGKKPCNYLKAVAAASKMFKGAAKRSSADGPKDQKLKKNK